MTSAIVASPSSAMPHYSPVAFKFILDKLISVVDVVIVGVTPREPG